MRCGILYLDAFWLNKYAICEDHRFTRTREPVNKDDETIGAVK
jgi:hypothetical protein